MRLLGREREAIALLMQMPLRKAWLVQLLSLTKLTLNFQNSSAQTQKQTGRTPGKMQSTLPVRMLNMQRCKARVLRCKTRSH
jgi:hypothetical protein